MSKVIRFLSGAIMGGVLGSAAVLLLAPGSGSETRAAMMQKVSMLGEQMQTAMREKRAEMEEELENLKQA
jgi:gas vesicle protein